MNDGGGGGGYAGTYWWNVDVPYMWEVLENQETTPHFEVVAGWGLTIGLLIDHLSTVKSYRDRLVEVWPPERSAASAAYVARLDDLIAVLWRNHEAAVANYQALGVVAQALHTARARVRSLYAEYVRQEQAEAGAEAVRRASAGRVIAPSVASRKAELNEQARAVMYDLSNAIVSGRTALQVPEPYDPARLGQAEQDAHYGGGSGHSAAMTVGLSAGEQAATKADQAATKAEQAADQAASKAEQAASKAEQAATKTMGVPPVAASSPVIVPVPGAAQRPGDSARRRAGVSSPVDGVGSARPIDGIIDGRPPGGPMRSPSSRTEPEARGGPVRSVNPIGGVISSRGGGPSGVAALGQPSAHRRGRRAGPVGRWDPNNPWEVAEGVPPVVQAPPDPGLDDPGPVIGLNR